MKKVIIIGSGFSGLSAASYMAKAGWDVTVIEKHDIPGGRARRLKENGFIFDMGPSWYWMPGVFEQYFENFGKKISDYYKLKRLDPSYEVYWQNDRVQIPAGYEALKRLFEDVENGSSLKLDEYLEQAQFKYNIGINKLVQKPGRLWMEFADREFLRGILKMDVFTSIKSHIHKYFKDTRLRQLLEFPILFLGALPENTPALYSLMNYADIIGGTWYPEKGIYSVVEAMYSLASELGVKFLFNEDALSINISDGAAGSITTETSSAIRKSYNADVIISSADYHFTETRLVEKRYRSYTNKYWEKRTMAPGCLLYYIGLNKKLTGITHHSLFFDVDFNEHARDIYKTKKWPADPLFYVSATSVSDNTVAPGGHENLFFLIPVASGLTGDTDELRERYFEKILQRFEARTGQDVKNSIVYKKTFGPSDFAGEYNAFKGNAYGLANTLMQTAVLKPSCKSRKVKNLFYAGQLTVPGPGVPPSLISGEVVAREVIKQFGH